MESHFMSHLLSARMFAKANWKLTFRPETKSVCSKPLPLLECHSSSCRHQCFTAQASSLVLCLLELLGVACHSLLSRLWVYLLPREPVLVNIQASLPNKVVVVAQALNRCLLTFTVFLLSFLREWDTLKAITP